MNVLTEDNLIVDFQTEYTIPRGTGIWVLDSRIMDYTLTAIDYFEEWVSPGIKVSIAGVEMWIPGGWSILVGDEETGIMDIADFTTIAGRDYTAVVGGLQVFVPTVEKISVVGFTQQMLHSVPGLPGAHLMMCLPISTTRWVSIAPCTNNSLRYMTNKTMGEL